MKIAIYLIVVILTLTNTFSAQPKIKWWFDTKDASAGQTAAGDIDDDGKLELAFGCYRNDSCVYALNSENGTLLWKYNTATKTGEGCNDVASLIFDIDGDGIPEVITPSSCNPTTFCFDGKTGEVKWATPTRGSDSPPTIADLDNDGKLEILHGEFMGYVKCMNAEDGKPKWEISVCKDCWIQTAPTIVDVNNDGQLDFVVASWNFYDTDTNKVYAYDGKTLEVLWEFPVNDVIYHGTAVADLDKDGNIELLIGDYSGEMFVINGKDGTKKWSHKFPENYFVGGPVSIADLDNDGYSEIVFSGWFKMVALRYDGSIYWEYDIPEYSSCFRGVALSDIDDDAMPDVIFGTQKGMLIALKGTTGDTIWTLNLAEHYGKEFDINHAPIISDFDKDGILDVFIVGGYMEYPKFSNGYGRAYCIEAGKGSGPDWLMFQNNESRNNNYSYIPSSVDFINFNNSNTITNLMFNSLTNDISFSINFQNDTQFNISIYNLIGHKLMRIEGNNHSAGDFNYTFNLNQKISQLASGIYLLQIEIPNISQLGKLIYFMK